MKKTYTSPEMVVRGTIEEITQGPWGGSFDTFFGGDGGLNPFKPKEEDGS